MDGSPNDFARNQAIGFACLEYSDKPMIMINADNIIVRVSAAMCDLLAKKSKEMIGKSLAEFIPDDYSHPHGDPIDWIATEYENDKIPSIRCVPFQCNESGKIVHLNLRVIAIKWPNGSRPDFIAFATVSS